MRRVRALLLKELWHHGPVVSGLAVVVIGIFFLLLLSALIAPRTITLLETHATFVRFFTVLIGFALGNRLVVREYQDRTQRFLEALPLRRAEMVLTKLVLGFVVLAGLSLGSLALSVAVAALREPLTATWIAIVMGRTLLFVAALWSSLFTMGLLGRWRIPLYIGAGITLLVLTQAGLVDLERFGPIALVAQTFVLERLDFPVADALVTLLFSAIVLAIGLSLALVREGSLAEANAKRMSRREMGAVLVALALGLVGSSVADQVKDKEPFAFTQREVERRAPVDVLYLEDRHRGAAARLADVASADLTALADYLGWSRLPKAHVALRPTLDAREIQIVRLGEDQDGILLYANFVAEGFDLDALRSRIVERVILAATDRRAKLEPHVWVARALAVRWPRRDVGLSPSTLRRALFVSRDRAPSWASLERERPMAERFGRDAFAAWAASAGEALIERAGPARSQRFFRSVLSDDPPWGITAVIDSRRDPVEARLEREAGLGPEALLAAWRARLIEWRSLYPLRGVPRAATRITIEAPDSGVRNVRWQVRFDPAAEPGSRCTLIHAALGPFDRPLAVGDLSREERDCESLAAEGDILLGRYSPHERALLAIEIVSPILGTSVRVHAERRSIE
ncbi:MAG: ABC transporter permease [Sandaracinaceae bacterium]|nr:ABC transporter permease [Sandaracinaceae bacterium]